MLLGVGAVEGSLGNQACHAGMISRKIVDRLKVLRRPRYLKAARKCGASARYMEGQFRP